MSDDEADVEFFIFFFFKSIGDEKKSQISIVRFNDSLSIHLLQRDKAITVLETRNSMALQSILTTQYPSSTNRITNMKDHV